jgi:hypothetical protein
MASVGDRIHWGVSAGQPIRAGAMTVTPRSRYLAVRWPGGGWVWNRPAAVDVEGAGRAERLAISDPTRVVQIGLLALSGLFVAAGLWLPRKMRRK